MAEESSDLSSLNVAQINEILKKRGIKGFSKLNKQQKIERIIMDGYPNESLGVAKSSDKKDRSIKKDETSSEKKKRVLKLNEKLLKSIKMDDYNDIFNEHKEEMSSEDILKMFKSYIEEFIDSASNEEREFFIKKCGDAYTTLSYIRENKNSKLSSKSNEEVSKILSTYLMLKYETVNNKLISSARKHHAKLLKNKKEVLKFKNDDDSEDEEEDDDELEINLSKKLINSTKNRKNDDGDDDSNDEEIVYDEPNYNSE